MIRVQGLLRNAVIGKEIRTRMRGWRSMAVLTGYMGILGLIAVGFLAQQAGPTTGQSSEVGVQLFQTLCIFQLFLILFITPASTAGAISGERQRQTWDLLLVTRLSAFGIVWGKLITGLAFNLLLILGALPLFSLVFLFGGVAPEDVIHTYIVFLATILFLGVISLFISALSRRLATSMIVSNVVALVLGIGFTLLALYMENWGQQQYGPRGPVPSPALPGVTHFDPVVALASALPASGSGSGSYLGGLSTIRHAFWLPWTLDLWEEYAIFVLGFSIIALGLTTVLVRHAPSFLTRGNA